MEEPRSERSDRPAVERAEELGAQLGRLTSLALHGIESAVRKGLLEPSSGKEAPAGSAAMPDRPATERAEELLDRVGTGLGQVASLAGPRIRRLAALAREEAEDIWAEAQHIRRMNRGDPS